MAKAKASKKSKSGKKENAIVSYLRDTRAELRKVHWPTRQEAWALTQIVLLVTVSMALFLGLLDFVFAQGLNGVIDENPVAIGALIVVTVAGVLTAVILSRRTA